MLRTLIFISLIVAAPSSVLAWGSDGHRIEIAEQHLQPETTPTNPRVARDRYRLPGSYADVALAIVNEQLARAGVRLAAVLNRALN
jgi:hypothetical protein